MASPFDPTSRDPTRWLAAVRRHGAEPTAFWGVKAGLRHWFAPQPGPEDPDEAVAYGVAAGHWVAVGPPMAAPGRQAAVAQTFAAAARAAGATALFFGADADFCARVRAAGLATSALPVGALPLWDPRLWSLAGRARRSVRAQVHRAHNHGVRVRAVAAAELARPEAPLRRACEAVRGAWLAARPMAPMGFVVAPEALGAGRAERRFWVAERAPEAGCARAPSHGPALLAVLAAVPVWSGPAAPEAGAAHDRPPDGWFVEDLYRRPEAPNGTAEALVAAALEAARAAGCTIFTLGLAPLAEVGAGPGPQRGLRALMVASRRHLGGLYRFEGVYQFKARFRPDAWAPRWLVRLDGPVGARALWALLAVFAHGRPVRFGLTSLARRLGLARRPGRRWAGAARPAPDGGEPTVAARLTGLDAEGETAPCAPDGGSA